MHAEWEEGHPLRFRVAPADLARLDGLGATLEADPALQPGDLALQPRLPHQPAVTRRNRLGHRELIGLAAGILQTADGTIAG